LIIGNYITRIVQLENYLFSHFLAKDLGCLKYFLSIEIAQSKGVIISQKIYSYILETEFANCKLIDSPMDSK